MSEVNLVQTSCPYCGVGCGLDVTKAGNMPVSLQGSSDHPANYGRLCIKGTNLLETIDREGRLLAPEVNGQTVTWPQATDYVAEQFNKIIAEHGPDAVAFYVSGQILTEDYYVANKLIKGFIGSANIDTNSRLCMSSAVAGYKRAFGSDTVPCNYQDLECCDLLVLIGSNAAWTHPVLFQRIERAKKINPELKIVVVDPRRTASCEIADLHLPLKADTDVALFNGLLNYLIEHGAIDQDYIDDHCQNWSETKANVSRCSLAATAEYCDLDLGLLEQFYHLFTHTNKTISFYSMGVNQSEQGTDKCNAIINCHLATGRIGKPGAAPFSITGQPNAMGGREVGGLANMLAAHMDIDNAEHKAWLQTFWQSPTMAQQAGTKAIDMFDQIAEGKIKAVWIMATNPMVSVPNRAKVSEALSNCPLVVVSDCMASTDTMAYANVKLPATTWGEKNGTVTNAERRISRQRGLMQAPGQARNDWQIISEVGQKMGFSQAFDYRDVSEIFKEHAELSAYNNGVNGYPVRDFDISGLAELSQKQYDNLRPIQWPVNSQYPEGCSRLFSDGKFYTPSGKANFVSVSAKQRSSITCREFPYVLNSGRLRDHWHTMSRTGKSPTLAKHTKEPFVDIHPLDAKSLSLETGDFVELSAAHGELLLPVKLTEAQRRGELFAPLHWNQQTASAAHISACYGSWHDPVSGQPALKSGAVQLKPITDINRYFYGVSRSPLDLSTDYWVKSRLAEGYEYFAAQQGQTAQQLDTLAWSKALNAEDESFQWFSFATSFTGVTCLVALKEQRLMYAGFSSRQRLSLNSDWLNDLLALDALTAEQLQQIFNREIASEYLNGRTICSCFKVGEKQIINAITEHGDKSVEQLGQRLKCGTNCGSCKSELSSLISQYQIPIKQVTN
ncbi:nitrate reductase [Endozoicomonas sp. G2_1]|uniref:nitrate reductase n=1 Tax=Endozoicomonas sp. G2_1 TaxID=2821091 RepID=UPI001ADC6EAA|nr:nitrate reductase [Endozoicomonas sp. G2_1]MBO9489375.1 nitrate reductase [Endozoicomonas sp. G2_1]